LSGAAPPGRARATASPPAAKAGDGLVRELTATQCIALVVGTLIGTGIFLVPKEMVLAVHNFGWVMAAWVIGGVLSLFGALAYAELGAMRPEAGGEVAYLRDGWGPLLGFLFGWGMFWIIRPASIATIAAGFSRAASFIWPGLDVAHHFGFLAVDGAQLLAAVLIAGVTAINYLGVRRGGQTQTIFTALKLLLIAFLIVAAFAWAPGHWQHLAQRLSGPVGVGGFTAALVAALWGYDGWNNLTLAGSEIKNPQRTIPLAMGLGVLVVFLAYAVINVAYFYVLRPEQIARADNVAASMAAVFLGRYGGALVAAAVMISAFATINSSILSGARAPFALAREGLFFEPLARVHPRFRTPHVSLVIQAVFASLLGLTGTYQSLYTLTIFAEWLFYALSVSALFAFRRRGERSPYRSFGYPVVPALFLIASVALLVQNYLHNLGPSSIGLGIILTGIPYYYWKRRRAAARA